MYDTPPRTFAELVAPSSPVIRETTEWLRTTILREFPQVEENIYGGTRVAMALYSVGGTDAVALGIQPGDRFVKLFIHDPEHLGPSSFKLEGRGKHMRHIKFAAPPVERRRDLLALMRVPVERRGQGRAGRVPTG
jgi:hypothetical protein